jgi:hypothetical protein
MHTEITDVVGFKQWGGPDRPGSVTESDASQGIRINGIRKPASISRIGPRASRFVTVCLRDRRPRSYVSRPDQNRSRNVRFRAH